MSLTLFSSPGCHLCEKAEDIVDYVGVPFKVVDISSNVELVRVYAPNSVLKRVMVRARLALRCSRCGAFYRMSHLFLSIYPNR